MIEVHFCNVVENHAILRNRKHSFCIISEKKLPIYFENDVKLQTNFNAATSMLHNTLVWATTLL